MVLPRMGSISASARSIGSDVIFIPTKAIFKKGHVTNQHKFSTPYPTHYFLGATDPTHYFSGATDPIPQDSLPQSSILDLGGLTNAK